MRRITIVILTFLISASTGCQAIRGIAREVVTFPQAMEGSDSSTTRAASRISQKILLKNARKHMKRTERDHFEEDPSYTYDELDRRLQRIHDGMYRWDDLEHPGYSVDRTKDAILDEPEREGEPPVSVMGNKEILVDDEGSVKVDLPKFFERWLGKWPFKKKEGDTRKREPKYKSDVDVRLRFDPRIAISKYKFEVGLSRYNAFTKEKEWRLSLETKYHSAHGDWAAFIQWSIPW